MAALSFYRSQFGIETSQAAFEKFVGTLQNYYDASYYVDWLKVQQKVAPFRRELALLSTLCEEKNKEDAARELLRDYPQVLPVLPILIACRGSVQILENAEEARVIVYSFPLKTVLSEAEVEFYAKFLSLSGVLKLLERLTSLNDYVTGVEVGMDTNARKNRGGQCGVNAILPFVKEACEKLPQVAYAAERNHAQLLELGCCLPEAFLNKRWDLAFWTTTEPRRFVVAEVNHYGVSGSKLNSIAESYAPRENALRSADVGFIWITDGLGWMQTKNSLREAFNELSYVVSIKLASEGLLEHALRKLLLL